MDRFSGMNSTTISGRRTFRDLNLSTNTAGSLMNAQIFAGIQESIIAPIEGAGIAPADVAIGAQDLQLLQAIKRIAGANTLVVTSTPASALTADNAGLVLVDATSANITITLPLANAANGMPLQFEIVRMDTTTRIVSVALSGSNTLVTWGTPPLSLGARFSLSLMSDGISKWVQMNPPRDRSSLLVLGSAQAIGNNSEVAITWPAAISDTAGAATSSGFTVPAGISKVRVTFLVTFANNGFGARKARVVKGGTTEGVGMAAGRIPAPSSSDVSILSGAGAPMDVVAGDTFALLVFQDSGGALNLTPTAVNWFSFEVIA